MIGDKGYGQSKSELYTMHENLKIAVFSHVWCTIPHGLQERVTLQLIALSKQIRIPACVISLESIRWGGAKSMITIVPIAQHECQPMYFEPMTSAQSMTEMLEAL